MTTLTLAEHAQRLPRQHPRAFLLLAALLWRMLYRSLAPASEAMVVPERAKVEQWLAGTTADAAPAQTACCSSSSGRCC